jgi:hypothetical protein
MYPVEGYSDTENMWDLIYDVPLNKIYTTKPERNIRSENVIYLPESLDFFITTN